MTKVYIGCMPFNIDNIDSKTGSGSKFFPTIKVSENRGKFYPMEGPHHKFVMAIQPLNAVVNEDGQIDLEKVEWPNSQAVKDL